MITLPTEVRRGLGYWISSLRSMLVWQLTSLRLVLPVMVIVQVLIAAGFSVGIGLFFETVPARIALFLSTGASVITLLTVGIILAPQLVADEKASGTYDFTWSLPAPRSAAVGAWFVVNSLIAVPSMIAALAVGAWRYGLDYDLRWTVVPAVALVVAGATLIGYGFAHSLENVNVTQLLTQVLAFFIFGFTPINYPIDNLPGWFAAVHRVLPFHHMAVVVRDSLTEGLVDGAGVSYLVLAAWVTVTAWVTARALTRSG